MRACALQGGRSQTPTTTQDIKTSKHQEILTSISHHKHLSSRSTPSTIPPHTVSESKPLATMSSSTFSESRQSQSSTSSYNHEQDQLKPQIKLSLAKRIKRALRDVGNPPTYRYDMEHPEEKRPDYVLINMNILNDPRLCRL